MIQYTYTAQNAEEDHNQMKALVNRLIAVIMIHHLFMIATVVQATAPIHAAIHHVHHLQTKEFIMKR